MKVKFLTILFCLFVFAPLAFAQNAKAELIDEWLGEINCEEYLNRMDNYISRANDKPSSQTYIFVYEGKIRGFTSSDRNLLPQYGLAKARIRSMKQYVSKVRKFDVERFVFVEAGLREDFSLEVWNVPAGATPPAPTPTLKKIKYRKGKPYGFCLGCCP